MGGGFLRWRSEDGGLGSAAVLVGSVFPSSDKRRRCVPTL